MTNTIQIRRPAIYRWLLNQLRAARNRLRWRAERYRLGLAFARDRMTVEQARAILFRCERPAQMRTLIALCDSDVLERAREKWGDHPDLPELASEATEDVAGRWQDFGDTVYNAETWAIDRIAEYAESNGITLTAIKEE